MKCVQTTNTLDVYGELVFQGSIVSMSFHARWSLRKAGSYLRKQYGYELCNSLCNNRIWNPKSGSPKTQLFVPSFGRSLNSLFLFLGREIAYIQKIHEVQVGK